MADIRKAGAQKANVPVSKGPKGDVKQTQKDDAKGKGYMGQEEVR